VHGEMRCRARIILILALAKWQELRGVCIAKSRLLGAFLHIGHLLRENLREKFSPLCKKF